MSEDLARSFIKGYFLTSVYNVDQVHKFYSPSAAVVRSGVRYQGRLDVSATAALALNAPAGSAVTVASYSVAPVGPLFHLAVNGVIDAGGAKSGFAQSFVLESPEAGGARLWIVSDTRTVFDAAFFAGVRPADVSPVQPERAAAPAAAPQASPPPGLRPQQQRPQEQRPESRGGRSGRRQRGRNADHFTWRAD
jgi:hypothetical protein